MATCRIKYLKTLIPLSERRIPKYPIYQKGNPQVRDFLPRFWMKLVKPEKETPPDRVCFIVHPQMTKYDIKNYLEKIYKVKTVNIRTDVRPGAEIKHPSRGEVLTHENDYKMAFVYLGKGQEFEFPDIFGGKESEGKKQVEDWKKLSNSIKETESKEWDKLSIPPWFR